MNILMYLIFGWLLGEIFHFSLYEYFKQKFKLDNKKVKTVLIFIGIALIIASIGSGFYRVTSNENVILTTITGNKIIKENVGIKYSLLSGRESINIQKQIIKFPSDYSNNGYELITSDNKPLLVNSFLEFKINDVFKWGIENKDSEQKLLISFASNVKKTIQKRDYGYIRINLNNLEEELKQELIELEDIYGIEIININLQITDTISIKQSKSEAEAQKISSESLKESYLNEGTALKIKYSSIEDKEFIKFMEFMSAIKEGDVEVIIMPQDSITSYNIGGE